MRENCWEADVPGRDRKLHVVYNLRNGFVLIASFQNDSYVWKGESSDMQIFIDVCAHFS